MAKKNSEAMERERIAASIARDLPPDGGGYSLSSATARPLQRAIQGSWAVCQHDLAGEPFLDRFIARTLKGVCLLDARYQAEYEFKEAICIKRVEISGSADLPDGAVPYLYRQRVALSWELEGPERLRVRPELGYQTSSLDGVSTGVKDLDAAGDELVIVFRVSESELVLEEGDDFKRLQRQS
jgi:hypothetical protein